MTEDAHQKELNRIKAVYQKRLDDGFEDKYSMDRSEIQYFHKRRLKELEAILKRENMFPIENKKIFEVGYGIGKWVKDFKSLGFSERQYFGIELDEKRALTAKNQYPNACLQIGDASYLSEQEDKYDIVLQATLFSSILDERMQKKVASEMIRIVRKNGMILWYDFFVNNPSNKDVQGISKKKIETLFPDCTIYIKKVTLAPPLARVLAPLSHGLCYGLEQLGFLNTHYFAVIHKTTG